MRMSAVLPGGGTARARLPPSLLWLLGPSPGVPCSACAGRGAGARRGAAPRPPPVPPAARGCGHIGGPECACPGAGAFSWWGGSCTARWETGRRLPRFRPGMRSRLGSANVPALCRCPGRGGRSGARGPLPPSGQNRPRTGWGGMRLSPSPLAFLFCRRFSVQRCARCHLGISASEMVMRARDLVYHLNCFTCTTCNKMLTTGDHFGMKDNLVYCRLHFETLIQGEYQVHFNHSDVAAGKGPALGAGSANTLGLPYYNGVGTVQKGRPRKRKSPGPGADLAAYNAGKRPFPQNSSNGLFLFTSKGGFPFILA